MDRVLAGQIDRCGRLYADVVDVAIGVCPIDQALVLSRAPREPVGVGLIRVVVTGQRQDTLRGCHIGFGLLAFHGSGPVALVDPDVIDQHLVGEVTRRDSTTHIAADREVQDQIHRVVKRPVVVGRARALGIDQVSVPSVAVDPHTNLVRGPPHLVGVPIVHRTAEVYPARELGVSIRIRLVSGTPEMQRTGNMIVGVA